MRTYNEVSIKNLRKRIELPRFDTTLGLENVGLDFHDSLSENQIKFRQEKSKEMLLKFVEENIGTSKDFISLVDKIVAEGGESLRALSNEDSDYFSNNRRRIDCLELIVATDGSRPSFLIKNGSIDFTSSPVTDWGEMLRGRQSQLEAAISAVGRINCFGAPIGTGFLVGSTIIVTNRHVLEEIGNFHDGIWTIADSANIDFGHEFRGVPTSGRSKLKQVVFTGPNPINHRLDHNNLDLAIIEIEDAPNRPNPLSIDISKNWQADELVVFTIGYPTNSPGTAFSLLDKLFHSQLGFKRLSPGRVQIEDIAGLPNWTFSHDATTIQGNSGSPVVVIGSETVSAGLHYGGTKAPLLNWGHILGHTLEMSYKDKSLNEILTSYKCNFFS